MAVTLRDIAQQAGVSITAVAHVLNGKYPNVRVSERKTAQIREAAEALGYVPNRQARSMVTGRSWTIGVVGAFDMPEDWYAPSGYFTGVMLGVERACEEADLNCLLVTSNHRAPDQFKPPRAMRDGSMDGVILSGFTRAEIIRQLAQFDLPCVQVGSNTELVASVPRVYGDYDRAFGQVVDHLYELGHRRLLLVLPRSGRGPGEIADNFERHTHRLAGLQCRALLPAGRQHQARDFQHLIKTYFSGEDRPTGVLIPRADASAFAAALDHAGFLCPRDCSLVGFGDNPDASIYIGSGQVRLAQVVNTAADVGYRATRRLLERIEVMTASRDAVSTPSQAATALDDSDEKVQLKMSLSESVAPAPGRMPGADDTLKSDDLRSVDQDH